MTSEPPSPPDEPPMHPAIEALSAELGRYLARVQFEAQQRPAPPPPSNPSLTPPP